MINTLTLGESIHIIKLMSKKRRKEIADFFHLNVDVLINWLDLLNLIRNICCHNGNLIDIKLKTTPAIPTQYREYLNLSDKDGKSLPHKFSMVVCVIFEFIKCINPKHKIHNIRNKLRNLCTMENLNKDKLAQDIGFKDFNCMGKMMNSFYENEITKFYPSGKSKIIETEKL